MSSGRIQSAPSMSHSNAEIVDLVIGVDHAQSPVEFEAIDDLGRIRQADMLRPQVAMSFHDRARRGATRPLDQRRDFFHQGIKTANQVNGLGGKAEAGLQQGLPVDRLFAAKMKRIGFRPCLLRHTRGVEGDQPGP